MMPQSKSLDWADEKIDAVKSDAPAPNRDQITSSSVNKPGEEHSKSTRRSATKAQIRFASLIKRPKTKSGGSGGGGGGGEERIAGELCRARDGRFVSCSSREATPESKRELRKKERTMERQKEQAENIARIGETLDIDRDNLGALFAFGDPDNPKNLTADQADALAAVGLVDRDADGNARISGVGRSLLAAIRGGDASRARDAMSLAKERADRQRPIEDKEKEVDEAALQKPKGGGGRGGKPDNEDAATLANERDQKRVSRLLRSVEKNGGEGLTTGQRRELERLGYGRRVDGRFVLNAAGRRALAAQSTKAADSVVPPQSVRDAARRALEVRSKKSPSQRGMTAVGLARARDLANGRPVSRETLRRMKAYFDRHEVDKQGSTWSEQGKGWQAWMGWGGDPGRAWANRMLRQMEGEIKDVDDIDILMLELEIELAIKHGSHNQATHGRKTGRRSAYASAYQSARSGGAGVAEARTKAKDASREFAQQERAQRQQQRVERLQTQAERSRRAAGSGQMTESQARRALQRAENLEARARGESPPNRRNSGGTTGGASSGKNPYDSQVANVQRRIDAINAREKELESQLKPQRQQAYDLRQQRGISREQQQINKRMAEEIEARINPLEREFQSINQQRNQLLREDMPGAVARQQRFEYERTGGRPTTEQLRNRMSTNDRDYYGEEARIAKLQLRYDMDTDGTPLTPERRAVVEDRAQRSEAQHAARQRSGQFQNINVDTLPAINAASDRQRQFAEDRRREKLAEISRVRDNLLEDIATGGRRLSGADMERQFTSLDRILRELAQSTDARFWIDGNISQRARKMLRDEQGS